MAQVWDYVFGYIKTSAVKCVVELEIPDILEKHGAPLSLSYLSSAVDCPPHAIYRVMRFLTYHGIFKKTDAPLKGNYNDNDIMSSIYYSQTSLSRLLARDQLGPMVLLQGSYTGTSTLGFMSVEILRAGKCVVPHAYGNDPYYSTNTFIDAMACHARLTISAIINNYPEIFKGIEMVVDVGGSTGTTLAMLVKAFPWVRGICFDLPNVVAKASPLNGIEFVGGSMFECVPKADVVTLVWILHNWSDKECVEILKKCKEAISGGSGKVIIVDAVIDEDEEGEDELAGARLGMDITMMAVFPNAKERTYREWAGILKEAGFRSHDVKNIKAVESVIEAYP